jgi:hypothetical protein
MQGRPIQRRADPESARTDHTVSGKLAASQAESPSEAAARN